MPAPSLIVTVDTEEDGLWGGAYPREGNTVENIRGVERFQVICDRFNVKPTYLVDAPVLQQPWAIDLLKDIQDDGRCEIGAHLHPWCNPPFEEKVTLHNSYMCNLPESLQRAKLTWLTDTIEDKCHRRPTSFRAGRYGLDITGARILRDLGYRVDSSVIPFTDYSGQGGPNFSQAPYRPYFVDGQTLTSAASAEESLLEVPVTVGFNRAPFEKYDRIQRRLRSSRWARRLRLEGALDRSGLLQRIKFSPEQSDARRLCLLADRCEQMKVPSLVMMFHSSSLSPGHSPYVRTSRDLERFCRTLESTFEHCLAKGATSRALTEFRDAIHFPGPK
jgi:hypothetical protein